MCKWRTKLLVGVVACLWAASASATLDVVLEDFESYADTTAMLAFGTNNGAGGGWKGDGTAVLTLSTTEVNSGSQAMKCYFNNGASPYYAKPMKWLSWPSGADGFDFRPYDILSISFKCTDANGPLRVVLVDGWGTNQATIDYNGGAKVPVGDWVEWQIDLTVIPDNQKWMVGRVDLVNRAGDYGVGTMYFDDIGLIVPEPVTLSLLALGGVAALRRRRH